MADLGLPDPSPRAEAALAIRRVIARTAELPATAIRDDQTFAEELAGLGMFDDSLNTVEFLMDLEDELGFQIPGDVAERFIEINHLDFPHPLLTVADFTLAILARLQAAWLVE